MSPTKQPRPLRDDDWLSRRLGIPRGTLRSMVARGQVAGVVRLGPRLRRFDEDAVEAWIAARAVKVQP